MDIERRFIPAHVEVREVDGQPVIDGYAAVYNSWSEDLGGFIERIEPGFFDGVMDDDVRSLWNHNSDIVLGRTKSGTLSIASDERGLRSRTKPADTTWGRDAVTSIRRGDVDQMSFAFSIHQDGDRWEKNGDVVYRTLVKGGCKRLYDVSPVAYPAYPETSVSARALTMVNRLNEASDTTNEPEDRQNVGAEEQERVLEARRATLRRRLELRRKKYMEIER